MKILKMLTILIVLAIATAIGVAYYTASKLDGYVKRSIENYATQSLGTKVTVGEVNLSLRQTQATIRDLEVANPPGFEGAHAFKAGTIEIALNPKESKLDSVVIDRVLLNHPSVRYVKTKDSDNLSVLQNHAKQYSAANQKEDTQNKSDKASNSRQPRILIKQFDIQGADLVYQDMRILGTSVNLKLDDIQIINIDTGKDGAGTKEAVGKIIDAIIPVVKNAALKSVNSYLNIASDTLRDVTGNAQQYGKDAINTIKKLFQK
ncbi:DUF748 domain-containing protein [Polynucleobacter acidiphobus]|uniref:DUF748 domain-containing protein n=1 Tax=Polynucleobacter acidiphobus TaxID=556053 RepID=UPI000D3536CF|nr:hypothetical protein [Polynucleobacter acidiphobus]